MDDHTFAVSEWEDGTDVKEVFLYGHLVNDRLAVDYNGVFILSVSAMQELARQVKELQASLAEARRENAVFSVGQK